MSEGGRLGLGFYDWFYEKASASEKILVKKLHNYMRNIANIDLVYDAVEWLAQTFPHVLLVGFTLLSLLQLLEDRSHFMRRQVDTTLCWGKHLTFRLNGGNHFLLVTLLLLRWLRAIASRSSSVGLWPSSKVISWSVFPVAAVWIRWRWWALSATVASSIIIPAASGGSTPTSFPSSIVWGEFNLTLFSVGVHI